MKPDKEKLDFCGLAIKAARKAADKSAQRRRNAPVVRENSHDRGVWVAYPVVVSPVYQPIPPLAAPRINTRTAMRQ